MKVTVRVWRQKNAQSLGGFIEYEVKEVSPATSFLEMLDVLNEQLIKKGEEPVHLDSDCREGICGMCSCMINGEAHGPESKVTTCQTYMRSFKDGDVITVEPFRAKAFPLIKDLVVDRGAFDRIIQAGGFISVTAGSAPEANTVPLSKYHSDLAMDAAACIGCGACVAACKNASASLFLAAKVAHLNLLPQGKPEKDPRVLAMVEAMTAEGFGACSVTGSCEAVCPKGIATSFISRMNHDFLTAALKLRVHSARV
ncbi:MAG: succinate dehydrogenase/fumarate reductase iron-sulfur subunit [Verrucomicrobia bacterium]|nr:succinate dehydrogenase/fumarate reductase iron-sulfur subunit [Verrucomicrobiota bacterium]